MSIIKAYDQSIGEFLDRNVKMKTLLVFVGFSIICACAAVGWGHYQAVQADKDFCQFVSKSRENQILTAGDSARALISATLMGFMQDTKMSGKEREQILEQSRMYFAGEIPLPENLHPSVERLFVRGKPYIEDSERRVRERLPSVASIAPVCKDVLSD